MDVSVNYESGAVLPSTIALPTTLTSAEADLYKVLDLPSLKYSKLTLYINTKLTGATSATFRLYYSTDGGTTWFSVPERTASTGLVPPLSVVIDSSAYATGGNSLVAYDFNLGSATALKVTGFVNAGTPTLNSITLTGRFT